MMELRKLTFCPLLNQFEWIYALFAVPYDDPREGSARLRMAIDKELFISRCKNRLKGVRGSLIRNFRVQN